MRNKIIFILAILACSNAYAFKFSKEVCEKYGLGSQWYCEEPKEKEPSDQSLQDIMKSDLAPEAKAEALNNLWELQRKRAVITGKEEDLERVLVTQKYIAKLGVDYARKMMNIVEKSPIHSVTESYYQKTSDEYIEAAKVEAVLKQANKRYIVAFIYSSNCPYCKRQLPVLLSLQEKYKLPVVGVSVDGGLYEELSQNVYDPSAVEDENVKAFPTIMLLDSKLEKRIFVSKGLTALDQLEGRIYRRITETRGETTYG